MSLSSRAITSLLAPFNLDIRIKSIARPGCTCIAATAQSRNSAADISVRLPPAGKFGVKGGADSIKGVGIEGIPRPVPIGGSERDNVTGKDVLGEILSNRKNQLKSLFI